jgi:hypothetical protein
VIKPVLLKKRLPPTIIEFLDSPTSRADLRPKPIRLGLWPHKKKEKFTYVKKPQKNKIVLFSCIISPKKFKSI